MNYDIAVVKGDGIGPEVVTEAIKVLDKIGEKYGHTFHYNYVLAGGAAIDADRQMPADGYSRYLQRQRCSSAWRSGRSEVG